MPLLLLAYLGFISVGLPDGMLGIAWPHMRTEFDRPVGAVGFVLLVGTAGYLLSGVSAGFAIGRLGVGRLLAASTMLAAASLTGFAVSPGMVTVVAASWFLGVSAGAIDAGLNAYAARHFQARHMNWLHASYSFGATLGPLVVTAAVAVGLAWRGGYAAVAAGQLLLATAFALTVRAWQDGASAAVATPVSPAGPPAAATAEAGTAEAGTAEAGTAEAGTAEAGTAEAGTAVPVRRTLTLAGTWLGAVAFGLYVAIEVGAGLWAYTLLTEARQVPGRLAGVAVSAYWASLFVGRLLVGMVAERIGVHRVLTASVTGVVAGAVLVSVPASGWVTVVGLMLIGLAAAPVFPLLMFTTAQRVGDAHADRVIGVQVGASAVGGAGLPALVGVLIDHVGAAVLGPALLVLGLGLIAAYLTAHPRPRRGGGTGSGRPLGTGSHA